MIILVLLSSGLLVHSVTKVLVASLFGLILLGILFVLGFGPPDCRLLVFILASLCIGCLPGLFGLKKAGSNHLVHPFVSSKLFRTMGSPPNMP